MASIRENPSYIHFETLSGICTSPTSGLRLLISELYPSVLNIRRQYARLKGTRFYVEVYSLFQGDQHRLFLCILPRVIKINEKQYASFLQEWTLGVYRQRGGLLKANNGVVGGGALLSVSGNKCEPWADRLWMMELIDPIYAAYFASRQLRTTYQNRRVLKAKFRYLISLTFGHSLCIIQSPWYTYTAKRII
ncbi:hypothetical protein PNOK_0748200 [Pyrrhoderma noxium]|uniref:Uncharacterized protein n=1 Tax=Pyrrhoderma noxium TaxID=2282107 RepID=A0A286UD10_9AGAM|nr:hypothetical protein PNOK_0748200 [Pyrrhoderma noxium]